MDRQPARSIPTKTVQPQPPNAGTLLGQGLLANTGVEERQRGMHGGAHALPPQCATVLNRIQGDTKRRVRICCWHAVQVYILVSLPPTLSRIHETLS